jgi:hypothetical protein
VRNMAAGFCRRAPIVLVRFFSRRKSMTWDRRLYFPSEGRHAADFITLEIHRPRPGLKPRTLGLVASTLTPPRATVKLQGQTIRRWHSPKISTLRPKTFELATQPLQPLQLSKLLYGHREAALVKEMKPHHAVEFLCWPTDLL